MITVLSPTIWEISISVFFAIMSFLFCAIGILVPFFSKDLDESNETKRPFLY